jgi:hypothetical protein
MEYGYLIILKYKKKILLFNNYSMYVYLVLLIFIILTILIIFFNNKLIENFNCPDSRVGYTCIIDNNQYGICDSNYNCIPFKEVVVTTNDDNNDKNIPQDQSVPVKPPSPSQPDTCIKNQDFDALCKTFNSNYGVKLSDTKNCLDGYTEIECGVNYINGKSYAKNAIITPCLSKSIDFDSMCQYYNNNSNVPRGYNVNSIGATKILIGKDGDCYSNNGTPDLNKARAICNYNSIQTLPKLNTSNDKIDYNKFTECMPINSNFIKRCSKKLKTKVSNARASDVMGYDCLPGFYRAKCIYNSIPQPVENVDFSYSSNTRPVYVAVQYGQAPFGNLKNNIGLTDTEANWIWYTPKSQIDAPIDQTPAIFQYLYSNTTDDSINAILYMIVDDLGGVSLNGKIIGPIIETAQKININILPGNNLFEFKCKNSGGRAGLVVSVVNSDSNNVIFHTDSSWKFIDNSATKTVDYSYSPTSNAIFVTCQFGQGPWGTVWGNNIRFSDTGASWIWYTPNSQNSAPIDQTPVTIQYLYSNTTGFAVYAKLYMICDDEATITLNKTPLITTPTISSKIDITILPGNNLFEFNVKNTLYGAGLVVSVIDYNSTVLFHTDSTWRFINSRNTRAITNTQTYPLSPNAKVCGVQDNGQVFCADKNLDSSPNWTQIKGSLTNIAISNGKIYGTNKDDDIWFANDYNYNNWWRQLPGQLIQICLDSRAGVVVGVNTANQIYYADQNIQTNPNWTNIPGSLNNVAVSNGKLFGVNSANNIYYKNNYKSGNWIQIPGLLKQISYDGYNNVIVGVNNSDQIFYADQNITTNPNWTQIPGALKWVSISNSKLYGVNSANNIYFANNYKNANWVQVPGSLKQVSLDYYDINSPVVCGTQGGDTIWCADQNINTTPNWFQVPGSLNNISVSNGKMAGTDVSSNIFYSNNYKNTNYWVKIPGKLVQVSFDLKAGVVVGVNRNQDIFYANKNIEFNPNWTPIPGKLTNIAVSNGKLYGVNSVNQVYYNNDYISGNWVNVPNISLIQVSLDGYNNVVMGVNSANDIYYADQNIYSNNPNWTKINGKLSWVSISNGQVYGTNSEGNIYYANNYKTGNWIQVPGKLQQVSFDNPSDKLETYVPFSSVTNINTYK